MGDLAVAAGVQTPTYDPMATIGKLQAAQQGMLQNKLLGLQLGGKQALGQIIGANTDPTSGEVDWNKVSADAANRPDAAILMPEIQNQVLDRKIKDQQLAGTTLDVQLKRATAIANTAGSLLSLPEGQLTPDKLMGAVSDRLIATGIMTDKDSLPQLASFSQQIQGKTDPELRQILTQIGQGADATTARISTQFEQQHGGLSPSEYTAPTAVLSQGPGKTLVPTAIQRGQFIEQSNAGPVQTGAGMTAEGVPLAAAGNAAYSRVNPTTLQPEIVTQGAAAHAAATGGAPAAIVTGARPGAIEAATGTATNNAVQAQALQQRAAIAPERIAALKNIADTLSDFTPGPNSQITQRGSGHLVQLADQFGVPVPDSVRKGLASREEANKLFAQVALQQWSALGGSGSNDQLAASMKSNPSETISTLGMKNLTALLQGNEQAIGAQFQAWKKYSSVHGADSYGDFLAGWNQHYDPRAFQFENMSAPAQKAMLAKMSPDDRAKFGRAVSFAEQVSKLGQ